ncbi:hypothetical protein ATJ97_0161 [Georgenia soli]|uniref:Uncharacterized protein n=1 Tax=Georgenia soli TaxID=638953 RepID=A0A2A9F157_9MICO|nr:hypothetical protein ATJ97_0161 [Georgenia soli]
MKPWKCWGLRKGNRVPFELRPQCRLDVLDADTAYKVLERPYGPYVQWLVKRTIDISDHIANRIAALDEYHGAQEPRRLGESLSRPDQLHTLRVHAEATRAVLGRQLTDLRVHAQALQRTNEQS